MLLVIGTTGRHVISRRFHAALACMPNLHGDADDVAAPLLRPKFAEAIQGDAS